MLIVKLDRAGQGCRGLFASPAPPHTPPLPSIGSLGLLPHIRHSLLNSSHKSVQPCHQCRDRTARCCCVGSPACLAAWCEVVPGDDMSALSTPPGFLIRRPLLSSTNYWLDYCWIMKPILERAVSGGPHNCSAVQQCSPNTAISQHSVSVYEIEIGKNRRFIR